MDALILRTVLDLSDDMFVLLEPDGRVRWISRQAGPHGRGWTAQRAAGRKLDRHCSRSEFASGRSSKRSLRESLATAPVQARSPTRWSMEARIVPIVPSPEAGVQAVVVALSELELEKRLQTMRREFVANVSHELRSPLTSILGYAETLLHDPPEDEEQRRRFLVAVVREARRMQRLVEDLLNLSRIESGRAAPRFEGVNLHNIVGRVLDPAAGPKRSGPAYADNNVPADLRLECDPGQIEQVVYNLVSNGIQYTPAGGKSSCRRGRRGQQCIAGHRYRYRHSRGGFASHFRALLPRGQSPLPRDRAPPASACPSSNISSTRTDGKVSVESEPGHGASFTVEAAPLQIGRRPEWALIRPASS